MSELYDRINALGAPLSACVSDYDRGYRDAIEKALDLIGEDRCACGAMSERDCGELPGLRHCGGATAKAEGRHD